MCGKYTIIITVYFVVSAGKYYDLARHKMIAGPCLWIL